MDTLPYDVLRLLPQWFDWSTYLACIRVCRLWAKIFSLPEKLPIYFQSWEYCDMPIMGTLTLGKQSSLPPIDPRIITEVLAGGYDWVDGYSVVWFDVPKQEVFAYLSRPRMRWTIYACISTPYLCEGCRIIASSNKVYGSTYAHYLVAEDNVVSKDTNNELQFSIGSLYPYSCPLPIIEEVDQGFLSSIVLKVSNEKPLNAEYLYLTLNQLGECYIVTYMQEGVEMIAKKDLADMEPMLFVTLNLRCGFRVCSNEEFPGEEVVNKIGRYALEMHSMQS